MPIPPELERAIRAQVESARTLRDSIEADPLATIEPPSRIGTTTGDQALEVMRALDRGKDAGHVALRFEKTLGEGGMGIVHLATQSALSRKVAVKRLQDDQKNETGVTRIIQEAMVTGGLEHPNIVPVYDVSLDADGFPAIVLKRIEGEHWGTLLRSPERIKEHVGADDPEDFNLRTLMQVCNAIHFAHSRGVVHRDLKPENVMIGEFGEVYVLDWGLAVGIDDNDFLPRAEKARGMAGTPAYMAPEMLGTDDSAPLTERTDVYLLGAMLYEVITGSAPHIGQDLEAVVSSVILSQPKFPRGTPRELRKICQRAMARDPADRFSSAEELRKRLDRYLRHRGSLQLAADAQRSFDQLAEMLGRASSDDEHQRELYNLFGECRFGFRAALEGWGGNPVAINGLQRSTIALVNFELAQGDAHAAARLLAELDNPPSELVARVESARHASVQEVENLRALSRELDPQSGSRTRSAILIGLGAMWTVLPAFAERFEAASGGPTHAGQVITSAVFLVIIGVLGFWGRKSMLKTAVNRSILATIVFTMLAMIMLRAGAALLDIEPRTAHVLNFFIWFTICSLLSFYVDLRLVVAAAAYLAAFLLAAAYPSWMYVLMAGSNLVLTLIAVWLWWPRWTQRQKAVTEVKRLIEQVRAPTADRPTEPPPAQ